MKLKRIFFVIFMTFIFSLNINAEETITITKKLTGVDLVNNTYTYTITPRETNPDNSNFNNNTFDIVFDENTSINNREALGTYVLDFSTINYTIPGRYEYIVRETSTSDTNAYPVDENYYVINLNVLNELNENTPTGNLIVDVLQSAFVNDSAGKSDIVFETRPMTYLTLSKNVSGDLGNINEYFKFKVNISDGDNYIISGQDSSVVYNGEVINTSSVYNSETDNYVYLKHGQTLTIGLNEGVYEIPSGALLDVMEMDATNYKTYVNDVYKGSKTSNKVITNTPESNILSYVNNYESTVLTGLFVSIVPFVILVVISILSIYVLKKKSRKNNA